jgi:phosphonate transport system substrate-binding protein
MKMETSRRAFLAAAGSGLALASFGTATAQTRDPTRLRVALLPDENAATIILNAQPLKAHLERRWVRKSKSSSRPTIRR